MCLRSCLFVVCGLLLVVFGVSFVACCSLFMFAVFVARCLLFVVFRCFLLVVLCHVGCCLLIDACVCFCLV